MILFFVFIFLFNANSIGLNLSLVPDFYLHCLSKYILQDARHKRLKIYFSKIKRTRIRKSIKVKRKKEILGDISENAIFSVYFLYMISGQKYQYLKLDVIKCI